MKHAPENLHFGWYSGKVKWQSITSVAWDKFSYQEPVICDKANLKQIAVLTLKSRKVLMLVLQKPNY